jgi:large subunit ribosomal protein L21
MYAVIRTGGKQYRVAENQRITVERMAGEPGDTVRLDDVLMISEEGQAPLVGPPGLDKAAVFAEVVEQTRGDKIIVFKKNRRKNYRRKKGHRQDLTLLRIAGISASGKDPNAKKKKATEPEPSTVATTPQPSAEQTVAEPQTETAAMTAGEATETKE